MYLAYINDNSLSTRLAWAPGEQDASVRANIYIYIYICIYTYIHIYIERDIDR